MTEIPISEYSPLGQLTRGYMPNFIRPLSIHTMQVLSLALGTLGAAVMFGWVINSSLLVQILPNSVPMQFNTALCFTLSGLALYCTLRLKEAWAVTAALVVMCLATATLFQYLLDIDFGIDQFFVSHKITTLTSHPGRMSPNSAVCFILLSAAVLTEVFLWQEDYLRIRHYLFGGILLILSGTALVGHLTGTQTAYGWNYSGMALHTSLGIFMAGMVIASLGYKRGNLSEIQSRIYLSFLIFIFFSSAGYFSAAFEKKREIDSFIQLYNERTQAITTRVQSRAMFVNNSIEKIFPQWTSNQNITSFKQAVREKILTFDAVNQISLTTYAFDSPKPTQKTIIAESREGADHPEVELSQDQILTAILNHDTSWQALQDNKIYFAHQHRENQRATVLLTVVTMDKIIDGANTEDIRQTFSVQFEDPHSADLKHDWLQTKFVHPAVFGALKKVIVFSRPNRKLYRDDSKWFWFLGQGLVIATVMALLCFFYLQLKAERYNLISIINTTPIALIGCNHDGKIVIANREASKLFGYSRQELLALSIEELVPIDAAKHDQWRSEFIDKRKPRRMGSGAIQGLTKTGDKINVSVHLDFMVYEDEQVILATIEDRRGGQTLA